MNDNEGKSNLKCGIIMPISEMEECSELHWREVKSIIMDSIHSSGFEPELVSDADEVRIIQKTIIQNLYENPIVVCDVSGKNPNVMFELGIRLAFDKPTIIVKDDKTNFTFDTSIIEHIIYPRDLRYSNIIDFKEKLTNKIKSTYEIACRDKNYTTFLKHFGEFTSPKLDTKVVSKEDFIIEELKQLKREITLVGRRQVEARGEERYVYREKDAMIELERMIENSIMLLKSNNEDITSEKAIRFIMENTPVKYISERYGISRATVSRMVSRMIEKATGTIQLDNSAVG